LEHKHDDTEEQHMWDGVDPYPSVPEWLQTWPHLFTYIPRNAQDVWTSICAAKLGEVFNLYRASDVDTRDKLILEFLQLPRLLLGRVANQSNANKHLAKTLHEHLSSGQPPARPPDPPPKPDLRDDMTRRISAANRKVAQGHVGKALQADKVLILFKQKHHYRLRTHYKANKNVKIQKLPNSY